MKKYIYNLFAIILIIVCIFLAIRFENQEDLRKKGISKKVNNFATGFTLYNSRKDNVAYLKDLSGKVINEWVVPEGKKEGIHHVELDKDGNLYAVIQVRKLVKYDWNNNLIWSKNYNVHHDVSLESDKVYSFKIETINIEYKNKKFSVFADDLIIINSNTGKLEEKFSLYNILKPYLKEATFELAYNTAIVENKISDFLHFNSIQYINFDIPNLCNKGDILLSAREANLVFILDPKTRKIKWIWGDEELDQSHQATLLRNGNIILLDNGKYNRNYSRILEVNAIKKEIVWEYTANPPKSFYTRTQGGVQRLENGNTIVTSGNQGWVFELDKNENIVWSFKNTQLDKNNRPLNLYRSTRYPVDYLNPKLLNK